MHRTLGDARDWFHVFDRVIERLALEQCFVDMRLCPAEQDRVAVGTSADDLGGAKRRAAATDVFDHHSTQQGLHLGSPGAADGVECTARRKGDHELDRPCRIGLRARDRRVGQKCGSASDQMQKSTTGKFHRGLHSGAVGHSRIGIYGMSRSRDVTRL